MAISPQTTGYDSYTSVKTLTGKTCIGLPYNSNESVRVFKERVIEQFQLDVKPEKLMIIYAGKLLTGKMGSLGINFKDVCNLHAIVKQ
jgi:Ubiquitin family